MGPDWLQVGRMQRLSTVATSAILWHPTISDIEIRDTYIKKTFFNIFMENSPVNPLPPFQCCYFGPKNQWLHHTKQ